MLTLEKNTADITNAKCTCPAGQGPFGSCKHLSALCYALEDYVKLRDIAMEAGEHSCTSLLQKWNQPRKRRLDSKKVQDIDFSSLPHGKDAPTRIHYKSYDPRPPSMQKTTKTELEELTEQLNTLATSCGFLHLLSRPSEAESVKSAHSLPLTPRSIQARARHKLFQGVLPPTWEFIQECGKDFIMGITPSDAEKSAIEGKTRLQSLSVRWHEERLNRLTASNFGRVVLRKSAFDKLAKDILFVTVPTGVPSIKWGRDHEAIAFMEYEKQVKQCHPNLKLRKAGIYIGNPPYLGASPDGMLEDHWGNPSGVIEIKCPYSAASLSVREACKVLDDFYCFIDDNGYINLDVNHIYYYQIQGTMGITKTLFCDFIVWTPKSMECITINFDQHLWETLLSKLQNFYIDYMLPIILY